MRILKKEFATNRPLCCQFKYCIAVFFTLINAAFILAQSNVVDEVWQKRIEQDDSRKIELFLTDLKDIQGHLDINDVTYGINLAFSSPYNQNRPKELLIWHQIAGDIYKSIPNAQTNSLFHYQHALKQAETLNNLPEKIAMLLRIAELHRVVGLPEQAYSYAINAEKLCQDSRNLAIIPYASDYLYQIADHYIRVGRRESANNCFRLAIEHNHFSNPYPQIYAFNNWGVNNVEMGRYQTALYLFDQGIAVAEKHQLAVWVSIMTGNKGWAYFEMNELEKAKKMLSYELETGAQLDSNSAARAAQSLAEIALKQRDPGQAFKMLEHSRTLAPSIAHVPKNIHLLADAYAMIKDWEKAYQYSLLADEEEARRNVQKVEEEKRLYKNLTHFLDQEHELRQRTSQLAFEKKQNRKWLFFIILMFLISTAIGALFLRRTQALYHKNEVQLRLELKELKKQAEHYQNALRELTPDPNLDADFVQLQRTIELNQQLQHKKLLTEQSWREFRLAFEQIYPDFLQKISTHAAQFTPAELRLLTLAKLELKNQEIAETLGISVDGVKKGKQRLKKKLLAYPEESALMVLIL